MPEQPDEKHSAAADAAGIGTPDDAAFAVPNERHESIFCLLDDEGRLVLWNKAVEAFSGSSPEELASLPFAELFPATEREHIAAGIASTVGGGSTSFDVTLPAREDRHILYHVSMLRFALGAPVYLVVMGMDLTECRRAETALQDVTALTQKLIEGSNGIIVGLDEKGRITTFNPAAERVTGYSRAEVEGRDWFEVLAPRERHPEAWTEFNRIAAGGTPGSFRNPIVAKSGEERQIVWQNSEVRQQGRFVGTLSFGIDVSDQLRAEDEARSRQMFLDMVERSPVATMLMDADMKGVYVNPKFVEQFGYKLDDFQTAEDWWNAAFPDPAYRDTARRQWRAQTEEFRINGATRPLEISIRCEKGQTRIVEVQFSRVGDNILLCLLDLTARRQAEAAMLESEKKYRELVENLHEGIWVVDENARTVFVNPLMAQMLGYEAEEMLQASALAFVDKSLEETVRHRINQRRQGMKEQFEIELRKKDGSGLWVAIASAPLFDHGGRYAGALAAVMDISDRKRAEEALLREKAFSDAIIGAAPGAFYVIDPQANFIRWNPVVNELTGLSDDQLRKASGLTLICEEDRPLAAAKILFAFATGFARAELRAPTRDRGVRHFLFTSRRFVVAGQSNTPYLVGIAIDITDRKQAEEAVRKEKAFSDAIIESVPGAFFAVDDEINYCRWNSYLNRLTGLSDQALLHAPALLTVHDDDRPRAAAMLADGFATGYAQAELRILSHDRGTRIFLITVRRFRIGDAGYLVGVGVDTTERCALEQELGDEAQTDALTGLPDRNRFLTLAEHEFARMRRYGHPLSLWMLDIDRFEEINEIHGRHVGDRVLQDVVRTARQVLREVDILGRVGGKKLAALLPETRADQAMPVAERLRQAIDAARVPSDTGPAARCTVSIGIAALNGDDSVGALLERADRALSAAERTGRDKVCVADA